MNIALVALQFVGNQANGKISKRVLQENKARQIFRKANTSYPFIRTRTCVYQRVRNICFLGKFGVLCFLVAPVLRHTLLPYCGRIDVDIAVFRTLSNIYEGAFLQK